MFGRKARLIAQLKEEIAKKNADLDRLSETYKKMLDKLNAENVALIHDLNKAKARLREIQDKSNARTRKCRANKKKSA